MASKTTSHAVLAVLLSLEQGAAAASLDRWRLLSDRVMGGISVGEAQETVVAGRRCLRMRGDVRLENNGGFIQIATDLDEGQRRAFAKGEGIELSVYGNAESYNVHLRTDAMRYPWQSYRASFQANAEWQTLRLPFSEFQAHRVEGEFEPGQVRRIGLVAIGRAFGADLCVAEVSVY